MAPTRNYPMCENSTRYNRTRNFGLYGHAESKKTQKFVFRSALRPIRFRFHTTKTQVRKARVRTLRRLETRLYSTGKRNRFLQLGDANSYRIQAQQIR